MDGSRWRCRKEVSLPRGLGQADIVLQGPGLVLLLENKVFARDYESQLPRYWEYLHTEAPAEQLSVMVYLTPDGRVPTTHSFEKHPHLNQPDTEPFDQNWLLWRPWEPLSATTAEGLHMRLIGEERAAGQNEIVEQLNRWKAVFDQVLGHLSKP
jgi:hypothetical protein